MTKRLLARCAVGRGAVAVLFAAVSAGGVGFGPAGTAAGSSKESVWVASADGGPLRAYDAASTGPVQAVRLIANPNLSGTVWDLWGVTFDRAGDIYAQTFLSDATTFVFGPHANGHVAPKRVFMGYGPDTRAIVVDGQGYEYIVSGQGPAVISVLAPGAVGKPSDLYHVRPIRQLRTNAVGFDTWPDILAVTPGNRVVAALTKTAGNALEFFAGGAAGAPSPLRTIAGSRTGLGQCGQGVTCDHVSVAVSQASGDTVAAISRSSGAHISTWSAGAAGDISPLRTIEGPLTGLQGKVVTGLAISPDTGEIFAMVKPAQFGGPASVEVFAPRATGNVAPLRTFTDPANGFVSAEGIAVR